MTKPPNPPLGRSKQANWLRALLRFCTLNAVVQVEGFDRIETPTGIKFAGKPAKTQKGGGTFRGEYNPSTAYSVQDMVIISTGSNIGTYVCVNASTGNAPYAGGGYWVQLPGSMGLWM